MLKLIDLTFYSNTEYGSLKDVAEAHKTSLEYIRYLKQRMQVIVVKHMNKTSESVIDGTAFYSFTGTNKFFNIPFRAISFSRSERPDFVLVQGLGFPVQVILLRLAAGRKCRIIQQHHGGRPMKGVKRLLQRIADGMTDAYFFTASGNTEEWIRKGIIKSKTKCFEVPEASTFLRAKNKISSRAKLNIGNGNVFLWVGRLIDTKDPITILKAFTTYLQNDPEARLFMIFQDDTLLPKVTEMIENDQFLKNSVSLAGRVDHKQLAYWYSAADFYISGSYRESAGYAFIESMACGCIPIVTDIPPFRKMTAEGRYGFLFRPGSTDELITALKQAQKADKELLSKETISFFEKEISFEAIADKIYNACLSLK